MEDVGKEGVGLLLESIGLCGDDLALGWRRWGYLFAQVVRGAHIARVSRRDKAISVVFSEHGAVAVAGAEVRVERGC